MIRIDKNGVLVGSVVFNTGDITHDWQAARDYAINLYGECHLDTSWDVWLKDNPQYQFDEDYNLWRS